MLEAGTRGPDHGKRGRPLTRDQAWHLVTKLNLWPPDCDDLLRAAKLEPDRSHEEERDLQKYEQLSELWVFAKQILDSDKKWLREVVAPNIFLRGVRYCYFTADRTRWDELVNELRICPEARKANDVDRQLADLVECVLGPEEIFITNFALYNPRRLDTWGCGTKTDKGKAERFYTLYPSETERFTTLLGGWRAALATATKSTIQLAPLQRLFPETDEPVTAEFSSTPPETHQTT